MSKPILEVRKVTKVYVAGEIRTVALAEVDFRVERGEFSALVGPSGSGKTTLLNVLGTLDEPTSGEVFVDGVPIRGMGEAERARLRLQKLGFVFQAYNLVPVLSAAENVEFVLLLQGLGARERRSRALEVLAELGLAELADKRPGEMSGGQQQRVAIARAIAARPEIVLADEPTANLDSKTAESLLDLMERMNRERGVTFLFSTHDARVMARARRIVHLVDGRIDHEESRDS